MFKAPLYSHEALNSPWALLLRLERQFKLELIFSACKLAIFAAVTQAGI